MILGTFLSWTSSTTEIMTGTIGDVLSDLTTPMVIIMAIGVGLIIFSAVISAIRGHN